VSFFEHDGIRFHYELRGKGPVLVFCHGLTGNLQQPAQLIGSLPGHRLLLWDARGHGETSPVGPAEKFNFASFAEDLAALMDRLEIPSAVVGGISMGAGVSTRFAIQYPHRVRGLVLVRPAWLDQRLPKGLQVFPTVARYLEQFGPEEGCKAFEASAEYRVMRDQSPEAAAALRDQFFADKAVERRARLERMPHDAPITDWREIRSLHMPALIIGNEPDWVHPLAYAVMWTEKLPRGRFVQVPAKSIDFDRHASAFRTHLAEFLKSLAE
jgi:pimeloyl-ACP methyl ester carboxylesterase